jgi:hypothetical protein
MPNEFIRLGKRFRTDVWPHTQIVEPSPLGEGLDLIDTASFLRLNTEQKWLVKRIAVKGQPAILGGAKKTLKTSILIALAVAMAAARAFLGVFTVPRVLRVGLISGEAGAATIKETFLRICAAMMIENPEELDIYWGFRLPQLSVLRELDTLADLIEENGLEVVILDPLYLCLLAGRTDLQASNLYQIGPLLADVSQACLEAGATPILAHHTRMGTSASYDPPDLGDLAFAGVQEFARQWLLVGRREKYEPGSGEHRLWLNVGGSAGFSGCWALDLDEGVVRDDFTGRRWDVAVRSATEERQAAKEQKAEQKEEKQQHDEADRRNKIVDALRGRHGGETKSVLRSLTGLSKSQIDLALAQLMESREIADCEVTKGGGRTTQRAYPGYRLVVPKIEGENEDAEDEDD